VLGCVGFFVLPDCGARSPPGITSLANSISNTAQKIAHAALAFEEQTTGRRPTAVTVVISQDTVVVTLRGTFSRGETILARNEENAERLRELHRHLFAIAAEPLRREIGYLTGVEVCEATVEVETSTGTAVQVFSLAQAVPSDAWSGSGSEPPRP